MPLWESMRVNMQPLLIHDVKNTVEHAESFEKNKLDITE